MAEFPRSTTSSLDTGADVATTEGSVVVAASSARCRSSANSSPNGARLGADEAAGIGGSASSGAEEVGSGDPQPASKLRPSRYDDSRTARAQEPPRARFASDATRARMSEGSATASGAEHAPGDLAGGGAHKVFEGTGFHHVLDHAALLLLAGLLGLLEPLRLALDAGLLL